MIFVHVGPKIPPGVSPKAWRVARLLEDAPYIEGVDPVIEVERYLDALTRDIPYYATINGVPIQYQRHTWGC